MSSTPDDLAEVERALLARWPGGRTEPTLDRMWALVRQLGQPQRQVPVIHVAGTNGKTSTSRMVDELLRAADLRVGRFTSPHLESMRERIVLDGAPLTATAFVSTYRRVAEAAERVDAASEVPLSFFEVITAMAFVVFAEASVDAAVIEVGLGGTWDPTNVADGQIAVITPIGLDHTDVLGPDETTIAGAKAGIIKAGAIAVLAPQKAAAAAVLGQRVEHVGATTVRIGREVRLLSRAVQPGGQLLDVLRTPDADPVLFFLPLLGRHQADNALTALAAADAFLASRGARLESGLVQRVFAQVQAPGRLEVVRQAPLTIIDASHNAPGMAVTVAALRESFPRRRFVVVLATLEGKDAADMLRALHPVSSHLLATANSSPRSLRGDALGALAVKILGADRTSAHLTLDDALRAATIRSTTGNGQPAVLVTGSVATAGEARSLLT